MNSDWMGLPDDAPFGQEESDHTPAAFSPPTTQGDTNLTQPSEGEQPTSVEELLDAHAEYYIRETMKFFSEDGPGPALSRDNEGDLKSKAAIQNLIAEERRQAKIEEAQWFSVVLTADNAMSPSWMRMVDEHFKGLRGENNE